MHRVGPYELLERIGRGGMGTVWRARHVELGAVRAVKLLEASTPERAARFQREVAHLARVRHENVVAIHEAGVAGERAFFAMDLVQGETLDQVLERGRVTWQRAAELVLGIARGVAALHAVGIVHRDLKPANVALDPEGRPVVLDLGVAVAPGSDDRLTRSGAMVGTLGYMSPEQLRGETATPRSDVHALGLLLYELVTGEDPLPERRTLQEAISAIVHRGALRPGDLDPELPALLDAICARATDPIPERRHADAHALAVELERLLATPGPSWRTQERGRRARLGLSSLGLALLAGAGLAVVLTREPGPPTERPAGGASAAAPETRAPDPAQVARGEEELRAVLRSEAPEQRLAALGEWLLRHPDHPARERAATERRAARLVVPVATFEGTQCRVAFTAEGAWLSHARAQVELRAPGSWEVRRTWSIPLPERMVAHPRGGVWVGSQGRVVWLHPDHAAPREEVSFERPARWFTAVGDALVGATETELWVREPGVPPVVRHIPGGEAQIRCLVTAPDGSWFAAGRGTGMARDGRSQLSGVTVWRFPELTLVGLHETIEKVNGLAVTPAGEVVACTSAQRVLLLDPLRLTLRLELQAPDIPVEPEVGFRVHTRAHRNGVEAAAVSRDGRTLWSGGGTPGAGEVRAWEVESGRALGPPIVLADRVESLAVSPDDRWLLVGGQARGARVHVTPEGIGPTGEVRR